MSKLGNPKLDKYYDKNPKIVADSIAPPNPEKKGLKELIINTQSKLNEIEKNFGSGGNLKEVIVRNKHTVVGATVNSIPQGYVVPTGKRVTAAVAVTPEGVAGLDAGVPTVSEVDNWSAFPCGNYNVTAGNRYSVRAGGGGVHLVSGGGASLISETITKVGSTTQTLIGGECVQINGNSNVSIEGELVNIKSDTQVVVDSTLGVTGNIVVQGGIYSEGELFVNHITGPREIQQTLIGFTVQGAEAQITLGSWIAGVAIMGGEEQSAALANTAFAVELAKIKSKYGVNLNSRGQPAEAQWPYFPDYIKNDLSRLAANPEFEPVPQPPSGPPPAYPVAAGTKIVPIRIFCGLQLNNAIQLLPHGHEFPSIPMNLIESKGNESVNNNMRQYAIQRGVNSTTFPVNSEPIQNVPKYPRQEFVQAFLTGIITSMINIPGISSSYSVTA